ncbi:MAG: hypothetical protein ACTSWY_02245 [Promethearchaeota archaeon]
MTGKYLNSQNNEKIQDKIGYEVSNGLELAEFNDFPDSYMMDYIHQIFNVQFTILPEKIKKVMKDYSISSVKIIHYLLNEYTCSRLIHYSLLSSHLFGTADISDIITKSSLNVSMKDFMDTKKTEKTYALLNEIKLKIWHSKSSIIPQLALFLTQQSITNKINIENNPKQNKKITLQNIEMINDLIKKFIQATDPRLKKNKKIYYNLVDLEIINNFFTELPKSIGQILPFLYEDDDFYYKYLDFLEYLKNNYGAPESHTNIIDAFKTQKLEQGLLNCYSNALNFPNVTDPAIKDRSITETIKYILNKNLIKEILDFYEMTLPDKLDQRNREYFFHGLKLFRTILTEFYGQNFISIKNNSFCRLFEGLNIPEEIIESFVFDTKIHSKSYAYDILFYRPFIRLLKLDNAGFNSTFNRIIFSYIHVFDAFLFFISHTLKGKKMRMIREQKFEKLMVDEIIGKINVEPVKIVIYNRILSNANLNFMKIFEQTNNKIGIFSSNIEIPLYKIPLDLQNVGSEQINIDFDFCSIDLCFLYKECLFLIEYKDHLIQTLSDFEPIIFRRYISAFKNSGKKHKLCSSQLFKKRFSQVTGISFKSAFFLIVTAEESPFTFMLSFHAFQKLLLNIDEIYKKLDSNCRYIDKTILLNLDKSKTTEKSKIRFIQSTS